MNRRDFLKAIGVGAASLAVPGCLNATAQQFASSASGQKPNVIIILADDLGYGDVGCYGSTVINTPNIDALAKGGLRFTDFHSNGAMCSPTRAALLTGRYQQRAGIQSVLSCKSTHDVGLAHKEITFAELLKPAGYATAMYGKWHLGFKPEFNPVTQGFDEFVGYVSGGSDYFSHVNRSGEPDWWKNDKLHPEKGYTTELLTDHAIEFIEKNRTRPFCVYVPYQAVHFPFQGPKDKAYRVVGGSYWSKAKYGLRYDDVNDRKTAYKEMVESMDANVGRIVQAVRKLGLEKKTLIFFTSDNGAYKWVGSNLPCSGQKGQLLEGGHRVPAIAYWPGKIKPATVTDETILTMDLFPTIAALAGVEVPPKLKLDGVDIRAVLFEGKKLKPRTVFWRTSRAGAARRGPWKLLMRKARGNSPAFVGLYNLHEDIAEKNNLAEKKPELLSQLKAEYAAWEQDVTAGVKWLRK